MAGKKTKTAGKGSFFVKIELPDGITREARDAFSQLVARVATRFAFQGLEDWQVQLDGQPRVLGAEAEFHDLSRVGNLSREMRAYFASVRDAEGFRALLADLVEDVQTARPRALVPRDWMKLWRKHYRTQRLREGRELLSIVPAWKPSPKRGTVVRITPGQAFGTGTHPTTQLCLRLALRHGPVPTRVLDFGAGTGVLAIAALRLGAKAALAVESDATALAQCRKNARLNRVRGLRFAPRLDRRAYGLVFANVLAPVLLQHRAALHRAVAPGGLIFLSGILAREAESFLRAIRRTLEFVERLDQGDWSAIALRKKAR